MTVHAPTKHLPEYFELKDWTWAPHDLSVDYARVAAVVQVDPTAPYGARHPETCPGRRAGKPAGWVSICRAGTKVGNGVIRKNNHVRVRVNIPACVDPWARANARGTDYSARDMLGNVVWLLVTGNWPPPGLVVDHINHDATDNRIENLRLLSAANNAFGHARRRANLMGHNGGPPLLDAAE